MIFSSGIQYYTFCAVHNLTTYFVLFPSVFLSFCCCKSGCSSALRNYYCLFLVNGSRIKFFGDIFVFNFLYDQLIIHLLKLIHFLLRLIFIFEDIPISLPEVILLFVLLYLLRFLIKERRNKFVLQFGFVVCFSFVEIGAKYSCFYKEEFLCHQYFNQKIFSVRKMLKLPSFC